MKINTAKVKLGACCFYPDTLRVLLFFIHMSTGGALSTVVCYTYFEYTELICTVEQWIL